MEKETNLKEFVAEMFNQNPFHAMTTARDLVELEGIERHMNLMWGVELDIKVKPAKKQETRFVPQSLIDAIEKDRPSK